MSKRKAIVHVRLKPGVLDPQGGTIERALNKLGYHDFSDVRSGKFFEIVLADDSDAAMTKLDEICRDLLANPVIEDYTIETVAE